MTKGTPKKDGSGKGIGANKGRGGCATPFNVFPKQKITQ